MADTLGSSVDNRHLSFLRHVPHPTKILRRAQTNIQGLGQGLGSSSTTPSSSSSSSSPSSHRRYDHSHTRHLAHWAGSGESGLHSAADHFGLAGAILRRWGSHREELSSQGGDHQNCHHHHYHRHHHSHSHSSNRGFGPWRRFGSFRERTLHRECVF